MRNVTTDDAQSEVVAFLADPATYGLSHGEVAHLRTHISEIFIAGDRVLKVKRAVRYAFVDFSTLEARHAACEAEFHLNRRTAPEIYLGVVAVRRGVAGELVLDHPGRPAVGEPVEWAVVMRRFDEQQTFDRLAGEQALRPEWIDDLVDGMIAMHAGAEIYGAPYGGRKSLEDVIGENAIDMAAQPACFAAERVEALIAAQRNLLAINADLLDGRRDRGHVRRCHGDLHLANVVLWRNRPTIFDCIEFSDRLAVIDVMYDLAFLLMDLEVRGLRSLANKALSRYLGRQGEPEVLSALPLMMSLRACVRSKVTAMAIPGAKDAAEATRRTMLVEHLLEAAERFAAPAPRPCLVAIGGLSGTGKTTLAAGLAPELGRSPGALILRSDVIRKRLAQVPPERRLPEGDYTRNRNRQVYDTVYNEAAAGLAAGQCIVVDAVFSREPDRRSIEAVAAAAKVDFLGIWLEAPGPALKERVAKRAADASDATAEVIARQLAEETGPIGWIRLDASSESNAVLGKALARLPDKYRSPPCLRRTGSVGSS